MCVGPSRSLVVRDNPTQPTKEAFPLMRPPSERNPVAPDPAERPVPSSASELRAIAWRAAGALRGPVWEARHQDLVLGLMTLKYLSDVFEERRAELKARLVEEGIDRNRLGEALEDKEAYRAAGVCWVPEAARWSGIAARAATPHLGRYIDTAMYSLRREDISPAGELPALFARVELGHSRLGGLAELVGIVGEARFGSAGGRPARNALGEVYLPSADDPTQDPARAQGGAGPDFHSPYSVLRLIVEILEPYRGRMYDPACGVGTSFVEAARFHDAHGDRRRPDIGFYGQEADERAWHAANTCFMTSRHRCDVGSHWGDSLAHDRHPGLRADFVVTSPPFRMPSWARDESDPRWTYGVPPPSSADYAWLQHVLSKLGGRGTAGVVLADGACSSLSDAERKIRQALVEADLVAAMMALPPRLFHGRGPSASLWLLAKDKTPQGSAHLEDRRGRILFVDARATETVAERGRDELGDAGIARIAGTYRAWRGTPSARASGLTYTDEAGFSYSADIATVRRHGYVLTPGRYVNSPTTVADPATEEDVTTLTKDLYGLFP